MKAPAKARRVAGGFGPELARALAWQKAGQLARAEEVYRRILERQPAQPDACYLLGLLVNARGERLAAAGLLARAASARPGEPAFHLALGEILQAAGKLAEACLCYRRALEIAPTMAPALVNLGNALQGLKRYPEAAGCYARAIQAHPDCAEAYDNLGNARLAQGLPGEAVAWHMESLKRQPEAPRSWVNLAAAQLAARQFTEAEHSARRALELQPGFTEALANLAVAFENLRRFDEAEAALREAIAAQPGQAYLYANLASVLIRQKRGEAAAGACHQALALQPGFAEGFYNLGGALRLLERRAEAAVALESALALRPDYAEAWADLGALRLSERRTVDAMAAFDQAITLQPDYPTAHLYRAIARLATGNFAEGLAEYEWRLKCFDVPPRAAAFPAWNGEALEDKTILLFSEQGLGDTLQFVRYAALVAARGARVIVETQPRLAELVAGAPGVSAVVTTEEALPAFDVACGLMSLPRLFTRSLEEAPAALPYLRADPVRAARWRERLKGVAGLKVGLFWAGNPENTYDRYRSAPLPALEPLGRTGAAWYSLQRGPEARLETAGAGWLAHPLAGDSDVNDLAALIEALDLVVSVDSMPLHLAGALGRPVFALLPYTADWRWQWAGDSTPWYPGMRLFRQRAVGEWAAPVEQMAQAIQDLRRASDMNQ